VISVGALTPILVCFHKLEITPPSNFNHSRDGTEIYRIGGEIELGSSEHKSPNAQRYFEQALDVARAQQARSLELRAAVSLARLWRGQGRRTEARDLLARVFDRFTEGLDTLDLKEARALLKELAPRVVL
jgi:predicted ATPase